MRVRSNQRDTIMERTEEVAMVAGSTTPSLSWEYCPEELLRILLKYLSLKCLVSCMTVNRRWKNIVLDYIQFNSLWPTIISVTMANKGRTYKRKSVLSLKDILMTSLLWPFVQQAKIKLHHTYSMQNITRMHVYKENLILKVDTPTDANVKFFNIISTELTRCIDLSRKVEAHEIDYTENDYMAITFGHEFFAFGKITPHDTSLNESFMYSMENVRLYRLEDNICYILTKRNVVFALLWTGHYWDVRSRGRYYGNAVDTICELSVFNGKVYMVTKLGFIVCEDPKSKSFRKVNCSKCVARLQDSTVLVLFNENGVAVSVSNSNRRVEIFQTFKSNYIALKCGDMTCAIEHGEMMFIGYKDGAVAICTIHTMPFTHGEPNRLLYVQDYDNSIVEPCIMSLEVFEDKLSHHLLVATRHKVLQMLITYPDHVKACFE